MTNFRLTVRLVCLAYLCLASPLLAQVDYDGNDSPWGQRADSGPDAEVPGWFYNLGITGLRAQLVADQPKALLIKYVFPKSPANGLVKSGDFIVGAGGQLFKEKHRDGYGESVFGAEGPVSELAQVLEECQSGARKGKLSLTLQRGREIKEVVLDVGQKYGTYAATYPGSCAKSDRVLAELLKYLVEHQAKDGSFGDPVHNTFAPLALLASGDAKYLPAVRLNVQYHCRETRAKDERRFDLINWSYMSAAIVLGEYHLATGEKWVLPELQEVHDHLAKSQYLHMSQINPKAKKSHPDSFPQGPKDSHGGWGHNPGFEGYGPIAMLTGQGALAYSLMDRCGIKVDRKSHDAAYEFLKKGTGKNGYVWYGDQIGGGPDGWADMGRTGATGIANFLSPYAEPVYRERALSHAKVIGKHPQSFPDTHGSPAMGMAYTALAANVDADSFRKLMDANRWWFTMAQCTDGTFYYQPNRDNAGYGSDARMTASSVVAFIFTIPKHSLVITGKAAIAPPKPDDKPALTKKPLKVFILAGQSNMQGHASISTIDSMADDPKTALLLKEMLAPDGKPRVCEKVWITSVGCLGDAYTDLQEKKGKLTAGFGAPENKIGPEFTFGITMEKSLGEPVLIIKTAWGGRSLHTDFRPPSAGPYAWSDYELAQHKQRGDDLEKVKAERVKATGVYYREMIGHVRNVLKDIKRVVPDYDAQQGYELAGFVWFQGFNDLVSDWTYDQNMKPGGYDLYGELLSHFIRDVRKDLAVPKLPFVIGVMGIGGVKEGTMPPQMHFRQAQVKPTTLAEFKGNVFAVETAPFWDDDLAAIEEKRGQVAQMEYLLRVKDKNAANKDGNMTKDEQREYLKKYEADLITPAESVRWTRGASNGGYHYLGAAKILAPIGKAFAEALLSPPKTVGEATPNKPVKVFVLAGQSNMEGQGFIKADPQRNDGKGSLEYLTKDKATADKFKHLLDPKGAWAIRDDVCIHYLDRKGKVTVGYGAKEDRIGPELGFAHVIGDAYEEPVLLIKLAWGGKSLAQDFRPPSSGGEVSPYYKEIVQRTKDVLDNLSKEFPEFGGRKQELVGFGWHQGWNDRVNQAFNDEYEKNMANFIRDVRKDLEVPRLPFVIAETGMSGKEEKHPRALSLMKAQAAVAEYAEFQGNVAFVGTKEFWRDKEVSPTGQAYHWNTNAETYYLIGEAMGTAMKKLISAPRLAE